MKLTKTQLKEIIREEMNLNKSINESKWETLPIKILIARLQEQMKKGGKNVKISGTVLVPETGNSIIVSTEKQF
jgi:hypothetical protein